MSEGQARIASLERQMAAVKGGLSALAAALHDQPAARAALEAVAAAADVSSSGTATEAAPVQHATAGVGNGAAAAFAGSAAWPPQQLQQQRADPEDQPTQMNAGTEKQTLTGGQTEQALPPHPATQPPQQLPQQPQRQQNAGPSALPLAQQLLQQHLQQMAAAGLLMPGYPLQVPLQPHQLAAAATALAAASRRAADAVGPQQGQQGVMPQQLIQDPLFFNQLLAQQEIAASSGGSAGMLPSGTAAPPAGAPSSSASPGAAPANVPGQPGSAAVDAAPAPPSTGGRTRREVSCQPASLPAAFPSAVGALLLESTCAMPAGPRLHPRPSRAHPAFFCRSRSRASR